MRTGFCGNVQTILSASSGANSYQPMYSFWPMTSSASQRGSLTTLSMPLGLGPRMAEVMSRVGSSLRASFARSVRNLVRVGLFGVSLDTDQRQEPRRADYSPERSRGGIVGGGGVVAGDPIWISAGAFGSAGPMADSCWARAAASRSTGMPPGTITRALRSEEHTSELQSLKQ